MAINRKPTGRALSAPAGLAFGAAISSSVSLLAAAILAKLIDMERLPWENVGYGVMILLFTASFLGALAAYAKIKRQRMMICLMSGAIYWAILLSITALFFGGQYEAVGVTAALILGGSAVAGLLGLKQGRGGKRTKSRPHYR